MRSKILLKRAFLKCFLRRNLPMSLVSPDYEPLVEIKPLEGFAAPGGRTPCNLTFDDLCPKYKDEYGMDFGGRVDEGLTVEFGNLLRDYPHIAVTHFVIPLCMIQKNGLCFSHHLRDRYDISSPRHSEWLAHYKSLAETYNIEYALHGCYHRQFENRLFGRHAEFAVKTEEESREAIEMGLEVFRRAGLDACGFRQPAWDINSDFSLCRAARRNGLRYIAGSSSDAGFNAGRPRVSNDHPTLVDGLVNFPQNILLDWDIDQIRKEIDRIIEAKGIISIKGHFVDRGMPNSCSKKNLARLRVAFDYLSEKYGDSVEYMTLRQLAECIRERQNT
jgi:hypothetical protein